MRAKKLLLVLLVLIVALYFGGRYALDAYRDHKAEQQVVFVTEFYKGYLSLPAEERAAYIKPALLYSASAQALLTSNKEHCTQLSRGDDICGYGADGDVVLNTQETAPGLNFDNAGFKAHSSGERMVDVAFTTWPGGDKANQRSLRYLLVDEAGTWRVDDVFSGVNGSYTKVNSMRQQIADENTLIATKARDINVAAGWVATYVEALQADRFERFMAFPFELCDKKGSCSKFEKGDRKVKQLVADIHSSYFRKENAKGLPVVANAQAASESAKDGSVVASGPFDFTFNQKTWWLTKADLRRAP